MPITFVFVIENRIAGKLMLFGEYTVIHGGTGLILPLAQFGGYLRNRTDSEAATASNQHLKDYLRNLSTDSASAKILRIEALEAAIEKGLWFDSTIPQGYGLGSSGALVAAIYERYGLMGTYPEIDLSRLREILAQLEAPFHGSSSGLDPLVCYLGRPILYQGQKGVEISEEASTAPLKSALEVWLEDSERPRKTAPLVLLFKEKCRNEPYRSAVENELRPANDGAIENFLKMRTAKEPEVYAASTHEIWKHLTAISVFQWEKLREMIPSRFHRQWQQSLKGEDERWKLCGAGGGGFMIRFRKSISPSPRQSEIQKPAQQDENHLSGASKLIFKL